MRHADLPIEIQRVGYREKGTEYRYGAHQHDIHQWYCVLYGAVEMHVDGRQYLLQAEDSIIIPPDAVRSPRSAERAPGYLWAHFRNERLDLDAVTCRVLPTPRELQQDLRDLVTEVQQPADRSADDLICALLVRLLIGLRRHHGESGAEAATHTSPVNATYQRDIVTRVDSFMRNNLGWPLRRAEVARAVSLSPAHLSRIFRQVTHQTLNQHLTALRIEYAKKLLLESTLSITQIGLSVGYRSFSHFSSTFRTAVGISPSDYRQSGGRTWRKSIEPVTDGETSTQPAPRSFRT